MLCAAVCLQQHNVLLPQLVANRAHMLLFSLTYISLHTQQLLIKGPNLMTGYVNDTDGTSAVMTHDGYFKTGDLAHADEQVCLVQPIEQVLLQLLTVCNV
jgi:acyl-CoA synthetase (AMP-forming)/AMP-acid ligase II